MRSTFLPSLTATALLLLITLCALANPRVGFFLPDSVQEMTMRFKTIKNLIILPVLINGKIPLNLILDTGCSNIVVFGRQLSKKLRTQSDRPIVFSGLGAGKHVTGNLSISNEVQIGSITGYNIPLIVVPERNLFADFPSVDGIIGYDIFLKLEIEINSKAKTLTFRPAQFATQQPGYTQVPIRIEGSKPILQSSIRLSAEETASCDLIIDTGSSLGILIKTTSIEEFSNSNTQTVFGRGLNGYLSGYQTIAENVNMSGFEIRAVPTNIVNSDWHNHASVGMDVLKDYIVVLNYARSYASFKPIKG